MIFKKMKNFYQYINYYIKVVIHKLWIIYYSLKACRAILWRALKHDMSKFSYSEAKLLSKYIPYLENIDYGSEEYYKILNKIKPALRHHYANNMHHPEFFHAITNISSVDLDKVYEDGCLMNCMSPLDKLEMLIDWRAANHNHKNACFYDSVKKNRERFQYSRVEESLFIQIGKEMGFWNRPKKYFSF